MRRHIEHSEPNPSDLQTPTTLSFKNIRFDQRFFSIEVLLNFIYSGQISMKRLQPNSAAAKKMSRYIESVLLRFPLQPLYLDAALPKKWLVIDGRKRLQWLLAFVSDNQTTISGVTEKHKQLTGLQFYPQYEGKTFTQLPLPLQRTILETEIMCYVVASGIDYEVRLSIFERFQPSKRHTLSIYKEQIAAILPMLNRFIGLNLFKELIPFKTAYPKLALNDPNMLAIYKLVINALVVLKSGYEQYANNKGIDLTQKIKILQQSLQRNDLPILKEALRTISGLFGNAAFSLYAGEPEKIYPALFDVWLWASVKLNQYAHTQQMLCIDTKKNILAQYNQLLNDKNFIQAIVETPHAQESVLYRFTAINQIIEQVKKLNKNE